MSKVGIDASKAKNLLVLGSGDYIRLQHLTRKISFSRVGVGDQGIEPNERQGLEESINTTVA